MKMRIIIIGSGPTALGAAIRLMELGVLRDYHQVFIFEQEGHPGGLASTVQDNKGFLWDLGGHVVFSHYQRFTNLLDESIQEWNYHQREAYALFIDPDGNPRYIPYPVQNNLEYLHPENQKICLQGLASLNKSQSIKKETSTSNDKKQSNMKEENFEDWILKKFGRGLYQIFMKPYNQKVWTVPPSEMNSVWVGDRVAVPSYKEACQQIAKFQENDPKLSIQDSKEDKISNRESENKLESFMVSESQEDQSSSINHEENEYHQLGDNSEENIANSGKKWGPNKTFRFPKQGGTGSIWRKVSRNCPSSWIKYGYQVIGLNVSEKRLFVKHLSSREQISLTYDVLISTMPLNKLFQSIRDKGPNINYMKDLSQKFIFNAVHLVGIGLKGKIPEKLASKSWLYLPGNDCPFYRISIFSNYSKSHVPDPENNWSLQCEASEKIFSRDKFEGQPKLRKKQILQETVASLIKYGLLGDEKQIISIFHKRLDQGYPVPFLKRDKYLSILQPWLESNNIYSRGRFGGWKYEVSNQDHSFMQGVEVVDRLFLGINELTYNHPKLVNSGIDPGRSKPIFIKDKHLPETNQIKLIPFRTTPDVVYVIAHYQEDLNWLKSEEIEHQSIVYHKGCEILPRTDIWQWETLPNIGRESHTYLHYIIQNYHQLPKIIVFLQGRIDDHGQDVYQDPKEYARQAQREGISFKRLITYRNWGRVAHKGVFEKNLENGQMKAASYTLGEFWKVMFSSDHPPHILVNFGACFGVHRDRILEHSKIFYEKAISYVNDHQDPENGHYFERFWYSIFTRSGNY